MKGGTKHPKEFGGILTRFLAGLNKTMPPHAIQDDEIIDATNMYYDPATGYIRCREGLKRLSDTKLDGTPYEQYEFVKDGVSTHLVATNETPQKLYYMNGLTPTFIGNLSGTVRPSFAVINGACIIASGGVLQVYDGATLKEITVANGFPANAPSLNFITDKTEKDLARVIGCGNSTDRDRLFQSGIKDGTYWTENATPESDAKYLDVGYKDGLNLLAIGSFQNDVILFKRTPTGSKKAIYRGIIAGAASTWTCPQYRRMHSAISPHMVAEIPDGLLFIDTEGPKMITVHSAPSESIPYDITPAAHNIAGEMAKFVSDTGFIICDPIRMIAMVKPTIDNDQFYCMDYLRKRWTTFLFSLNIQGGAYIGGKMIFGATDGYLYEYDPLLSTDNDVAYTMTTETKWFNIFQMFDELVKEKYLNLVGITDGNGTIIVKKKGALAHSIPFSFTQGWMEWAEVNAIAPADWTEDLQRSPMYEFGDTETVDGDFMSMAISITSGLCALSHVAARISATGRN